MAKPKIEIPAAGSRLVKDDSDVILFAQPPDIVKGLLRNNIHRFDTLVLPDTREKDGSLLNNLEFPLYSFLFFSNGLAEKRRLNLVGDKDAISQALRLLRITLLGPTRAELDHWKTGDAQKNEWLAICEELALKTADGQVIAVDDFFNKIPFDDNCAQAGNFYIEREAPDRFRVSNAEGDVVVDLNEDSVVSPPYPVVQDYIPGGLNKFGFEVLGGASGFSTTEPCTGLALCFNGDYLLIDSVPFLNQHLLARGISRNQVSAVFLTHLHDDHCSMFPLMEMPHRVEIITTEEIFNMAMDKLSCNLGWSRETVQEHFQLISVVPGQSINYYGLNIEVHNTVHSVPTIGATFSTTHKGKFRDACLVADNHSMSKILQMGKSAIVRQSTIDNLQRLYHQRFHLLIADGGAGEIHGDPCDALESTAERVVFVHVEDVPDFLKTTFSVVSSGKRYTLFEGDSSIYTSQISRHLTQWLGQPLPNRWLNNLLAEQEIYRYNSDDVIIVEGARSSDSVYLILTGYCDVVRQHDNMRHTVAHLQAGDIIGEMAVLTGSGVRNASVIASTPVTVCVFEEETFRNFIRYSGFQTMLENRWLLRPLIKSLPQFASLTSTVTDKVLQVAELLIVKAGETHRADNAYLAIFVDGKARLDSAPNGEKIMPATELGWQPFSPSQSFDLHAESDCRLIRIDSSSYQWLQKTIPQFNYQTRKRYLDHPDSDAAWCLGEVSMY